MKILHIVPGLNEGGNGIAVAAKLIAREQSRSGAEVEVVDSREFASSTVQPSTSNLQPLSAYAEIWVHSMWLPMTLKACWKVLRLKKENLHSTTTTSDYNSSPRLVRMTHANLDPLRYRYHGWKKRLVAPIERWLFRRTDRVVVTCEEEKKWCERWGLKNKFEILDLKKFFKFQVSSSKFQVSGGRTLHVLYLGRRHPLKGVNYLEQAVKEIEQSEQSNNRTVDLRIVSDHFGEELEKDWAWCDVLVLPTLSENFGLVVAEALERGKRVVTTDGAPAWGEGEMFECSECSNVRMGYGGRLIYLKGFRDGTDEDRVRLLKGALEGLLT